MINKNTFIQLVRYALTGLLITAIHLALYELFHMYLNQTSLISNLLADFFSVPLSYLGHFHFTFKDQTTSLESKSTKLQGKFVITAIFTILVNSFWAWFYVDNLEWHRFYYMGSTVFITPLMSFIMMKFLVFQKTG